MRIRALVDLCVVALVFAVPASAFAQNPLDLAKKAVTGAATNRVEQEVNTRLLAEGRKNQCSFKTDSDQFAKGCDQKLKNLANLLLEAKRKLDAAGIRNFKFEVSGHTDSTGNPGHNKELSGKRAAVISKELVTRGIPEGQIISLGMGSDRPLVTPDNTAAKKAKNRRYEIQVRL